MKAEEAKNKSLEMNQKNIEPILKIIKEECNKGNFDVDINKKIITEEQLKTLEDLGYSIDKINPYRLKNGQVEYKNYKISW